MKEIESIELKLKDVRQKLQNHKVYNSLNEIEDVQIFMQKHVFAVWDFMSLAKALQNHLTCTLLPWKPVRNAKIARFINEIVWAEESDIDENGQAQSHFEMYLSAMQEVGANITEVLDFLDNITNLQDILVTIQQSNLSQDIQSFLDFTFQVILSNEPHKIASAFTFGREEVIPDMFIKIVKKSEHEGKKYFPTLLYYLNRHIELDGNEHSPLALEMLKELCQNDAKKWKEVEETALEALNQRVKLWDSIAEELETLEVLI